MTTDDKTAVYLGGPVLPSAEAAKSSAVLVLIYPPGPALGRRYPLDGATQAIGRASDADIHVNDESVSRCHASVGRDTDGVWLEDLNSTNGTFVNDERIKRHALRDGDIIRIGGIILKLLSGANLEVAYYQEIYHMAVSDVLTGMHNRRYFVEFLERELSGALRHQLPLALVLFDLDHFKQINDSHGHLAGDEVLKELGRRLRPRIRREDMLARYGGEEFAGVLTKTNREGALRFAESVRHIVGREPFALKDRTISVTISAGVHAIDGMKPVTVDEVLSLADENLYKAKRNGRDRVVG